VSNTLAYFAKVFAAVSIDTVRDLALPACIRLGQTLMTMSNTLAYFAKVFDIEIETPQEF